MSAVWVKLTALLCLSSTVQSGPAVKSEVLWKHVGQSITIQCRCPDIMRSPDTLYVKTALSKDVDVVFKSKENQVPVVSNRFQGRLQVAGTLPSLDILIKNLSSEDTGPYWCIYSNLDEKNMKVVIAEGSGSVLLVVKEANKASGETPSKTSGDCEQPTDKLVLVSVVISTAVLLCIIMAILMFCIKKKMDRTAPKQRRIPNNDVYEDMRGTMRR